MEPRDRIIVALDVDSLEEAKPLVEMLAPYVGCFKVGLQLLTSVGAPLVVNAIHELGGEVFYDGKFCDIPNTVAGASKAVAAMGVKMFNLHASAGKAAVEAAVANKGDSLVLGVTVLTSIGEREAVSIFGRWPDEKVLQLSEMLGEAGADGIICSPKELGILKTAPELDNLLRVTPGIRPAWAAIGDQRRITTPHQAIMDGADYLVIGRPIRTPPQEVASPVEAVKRIADEIHVSLNELKKKE